MTLTKISDIVDIFTESNSGIFKALHDKNIEGFDFLNDYLNLDILYYASHSGDKYASNFYLKMIENDKTIGDIASVIIAKFKDKWIRTYEAMMMEYNPINNYDMQESESVNSKITSTVGTSASTYGFGSNEASPTDNASSTSTTEGSSNDNHRTLTRSGNIGVTTSAQLLQGELEVRKNIFIESVMNDIDSILCLKIY